jgi:3-hydroxymyristoyl/3-hydroxydecanoyl-(acyl carrier protein) dehydratase
LSGSELLRDNPRLPAQLARAVLIGAPAHIRTLARGAAASLASAQQVVSLGAPLPAAAFSQLRELGLAVSDVYATRELGCLGWRYVADRPFRPLLEVFAQATPDRAFQVSAPHIAPIRGARIHAIPTSDGGFIATGVGVQRADWEERIAWLDGVHDAALLRSETDERAENAARLRESDPESSFHDPVQPEATRKSGWFVTHSADASTTQTGATATSVQAYRVALSVDGPARDIKALQARVLAELPALEIAQWRSLQRQDDAGVAGASFASGRCDLTRNGAGRHDRVSLLRLFGRDADTTPLSWQLTIEREQGSVRHVRVPERYGYFNGHFPGYPLLPGAAQLSELVVPFVRAVEPELGRLTRMARLKFQERIVPNDLIEVRLTFAAVDNTASERSVEFALRRGESVCASGRLWFAAGGS